MCFEYVLFGHENVCFVYNVVWNTSCLNTKMFALFKSFIWNASNLIYLLFGHENVCSVYYLCLKYNSRARSCIGQSKSRHCTQALFTSTIFPFRIKSTRQVLFSQLTLGKVCHIIKVTIVAVSCSSLRFRNIPRRK